MKTYRISFNGGFMGGCNGVFMGGCLDIEAKSKRKAIKTLKKEFEKKGMKIIIREVSEVKEEN